MLSLYVNRFIFFFLNTPKNFSQSPEHPDSHSLSSLTWGLLSHLLPRGPAVPIKLRHKPSVSAWALVLVCWSSVVSWMNLALVLEPCLQSLAPTPAAPDFSPAWTLGQPNNFTFSGLSVDLLTNTPLCLPRSDAASLFLACTAVTSSFPTEQTCSYCCSLTKIPNYGKKVACSHCILAESKKPHLLPQKWQERIQVLCSQREGACFWKGAHAWKLKTALSKHWIAFFF